MTDHADFEGLAAGYGLHALEPEDEQRLSSHLLTCASCARLVAETAAVGAAFADLITIESAPPPPAGLRARILEAAAAEPRTPGMASADVPPTPRRREVAPSLPSGSIAEDRPVPRSRGRRLQVRSRVAVGVLAAVVGIGVAVPVTLAVSDGGKSAVSNSALANALTEPNAREVTLRGKASTTAVAKAVVTANGVVLVATGLPVNDRDRTVYVLWAGDANGTRSAVATFDVRGGSPVLLTASKLPIKAADIKDVAVSYEPGRAAPKSPSDVVLSGTSA